MSNSFLTYVGSLIGLLLMAVPFIIAFLSMKIVEIVVRKVQPSANKLYPLSILAYLVLYSLGSLVLISFHSWLWFSVSPLVWLRISLQDLVDMLIFLGPAVALLTIIGIGFLTLLLKNLKKQVLK